MDGRLQLAIVTIINLGPQTFDTFQVTNYYLPLLKSKLRHKFGPCHMSHLAVASLYGP